MKGICFLATLCVVVFSCTKEKTDYEAEINDVVTEFIDFKEVTSLSINDYKVSIEALNGTFYKGYNEVRLKVTKAATGSVADVSDLRFLPTLNTRSGEVFCPHLQNPEYKTEDKYFSAYAVFTAAGNTDEHWKLEVSFTADGQSYTQDKEITVREQTNKNLNMTAFKGNDDEEYVIALMAPQKPKVAENELTGCIFKLDKVAHSYTMVDGYTLQLDPRMPEPSMGNHSSLHNKDLSQQADGFYHGVVNYTMTGNWTLNFIMLNDKGKAVKGTVVPTDFTPGVEGVKSELYIDILF